MRVLLIDRFFGGRDGPGIYIHDLAASLLRRGHQVALAYGVHQGTYAPAGLEPIEIPGLGLMAGSLGGRRALDRALERFRPDLAIAQCLDVLWFADRVQRACPLVAAFHTHAISCPHWTRFYERDQTLCDLDFSPMCAWHAAHDRCGSARPHALAANFFRTAAARHQMKHVDAVQAVTPYMRGTLEKTGLFSAEQIFDLPYPAPFFDEARVYEPPAAGHLLYVGRLHHTKGPQFILEAVARLADRPRMVFIGGGPDEASLRDQASRLGLTDRCEFITGRETVLTREGLSQVYLGARLVVVPSIWGDPAPLVRLEAMAHGRPLVGFDAGGVPDAIVEGETGFIVPRLDVSTLEDRIRRLLTDDALAERMGRAALARAHAEHHPDKLAARLETVAASLTARRSAPARPPYGD
jgi:glycosyltransferase involved in cell wall biosynthesis